MVDSESTIYSHIGGVHSTEGETKGSFLLQGLTLREQATKWLQHSHQGMGKVESHAPVTDTGMCLSGCPLTKHSRHLPTYTIMFIIAFFSLFSYHSL